MTDWTIMVYISADNVLANFAVESLKQLRNAAGKPLPGTAGDNITVVAEFDDGQQPHARMYYFDGDDQKRAKSIEESRIDERELEKSKLTRICDVDMTRPETLTEFVNFAYNKSRTSRYCLVIWGHGIELLLDESRRFAPSETPVRRYLSIKDLRNALLATELVKNKVEGKPGAHLDIIGFDACSMSMVEVATELAGCADFMVASQEDVPDASFPYEDILLELRKHQTGDKVREVCKKIPELYGVAFEDYVATPDTGVKGITLSSLDLKETKSISVPLKGLSDALVDASKDKDTRVRKAILSARQHAKDFVFGLLVDIYDFCECLKVELGRANLNSPRLTQACDSIIDAVDKKGIVVANKTDAERRRCHGISIYFPYRNENDATDVAEVQFAKGSGRQPLKGSGRQPLKERLVRIQELEADFAKLDQFGRTEWMEFIRQGWSRILAEESPFELDRYYSAEQVAQNLLSKPRIDNLVSMSPATGGDGKPSDVYRTG